MDTSKQVLATLATTNSGPNRPIDPAYVRLTEIFPLKPIVDRGQHALALKILGKITYYLKSERLTDVSLEYYATTLTDLIATFERKEGLLTDSRGAEMILLLLHRGLRREDLGKEVGRSAISKVLRGEEKLDTERIRVLAKRFKVSPNGQIK